MGSTLMAAVSMVAVAGQSGELLVRFVAGLAARADLFRRMASSSRGQAFASSDPLLLAFVLAALSPAFLRRCWRPTVPLTVLIVVNVALAAAIVVVLVFVMSSLARLTRQQPAASSTAPPLGPGTRTDLPRGPRLTHVTRAAQPVRTPARARVRT